ncbi:hypothetical protein GD429_03960 [Burkholderia sp. BE17]|nr:hypothetical protein [Burkholderia sp. BE17]
MRDRPAQAGDLRGNRLYTLLPGRTGRASGHYLYSRRVRHPSGFRRRTRCRCRNHLGCSHRLRTGFPLHRMQPDIASKRHGNYAFSMG